jgi:hypothetical protein
MVGSHISYRLAQLLTGIFPWPPVALRKKHGTTGEHDAI